MLTPIDIQSKTFKGGFGYDRKEVDSFVAEVVENYEHIYRENKELAKKVELMSNALSQYKTIEKSLQKALLLAQKTSDDIQKQSQEKARVIEDDARNRANLILADSKNELEHIHRKTIALIHQYELYRAQFEQLARTQVQVLRSENFHIDVDELNRAKNDALQALQKTTVEAPKEDASKEKASSEATGKEE